MAGAFDSSSYHIHSQETDLLSPFNSIQDPAHEMGLPMCRLSLPTSGTLDICLKQANA